METTGIYRSFLAQELAGQARMNQGQVESILGKFDTLSRHASPDTSFMVIHESYGSTDTQRALNTVRAIIKNALEKVNQENRVDVNPRSRLKSLIERHNKSLDQCAVEINGVGLSKDDIDRIKVKIPGCITQTTYTATASRKNGNAVKFALEIRL